MLLLQKGQKPTLSQMRAEIGKIRDYTPPPAANGKVNGFDVSHRGVETRAYVFTEREAAAARLMPKSRTRIIIS